jgi:hypothetical protein
MFVNAMAILFTRKLGKHLRCSGIIPRQMLPTPATSGISSHAQFSLDTKVANYGFFAGDVFGAFPAFTSASVAVIV